LNEIEDLLKAYEQYVQLQWDQRLAGAEKVWFALYMPMQERRLRLRMSQFEVATINAGHPWKQLDLTNIFAQWMSQHEYQDAYFEQPEDMEFALADFSEHVATQITAILTLPEVDQLTVVAITGLASLFGLTYVSDVLADVASSIRGRLLVFFPGQHNGSNYRFLDARDGWNYLATPISGAKDK
jgi:hypothetical protein